MSELEAVLLPLAVCAGRLDDAGGDGPAAAERGGVVQEGGFGLEVAGAFARNLALAAGQAFGGGGLGADGGGHLGGPAAEDGAGVPGDPAGGVRAGFGVKAPGGVPQVLGDVDEVDDDGDFDVPGGGFGLDAGDLILVAVGERDPGLAAAGVAAVRLGEY